MFFIYSKALPIYECEIPFFGIKIRTMNNSEKNELYDRYSEIYENKNTILKLLNYYSEDKEKYRRKIMELELNDSYLDYFIYQFNYHSKKPVFHKDISKIFDNIAVIEVDDKKLTKYIEKEDIETFIRHFFSLAYIYNKDYKRESMLFLNGYGHIYRRSNFDLFDETIAKFLYDGFEGVSYRVFYGSEILNIYNYTMIEFLYNLKNEDVFRFVEILEMYFLRNNYSQMLVVNNVLVMESLLIKEESSSISRDFVMKGTLILKDSNIKYSLNECKIIMDYLYCVRSDIVHGNTEKLLNDFSKLKAQIPNMKYPSFGNISKMKRKKLIVDFSYHLSMDILNAILKKWFLIPQELEFVKNC